jgi:hypothetical protein
MATINKARCSNGWPVLTSAKTGTFPRLRTFHIPETRQTLNLRDGSAGFLLTLAAYEWHLYTEPLDSAGHPWDEWGHNVRPIRGKLFGYSNHSGGVACDLNATQHPRGVAIAKTMTPAQIKGVRARLLRYDGCLGWGGNYRLPWNVDGMHFEIIKPLADVGNVVGVERTARRLMATTRGKAVLAANPGLREVILS